MAKRTWIKRIVGLFGALTVLFFMGLSPATADEGVDALMARGDWEKAYQEALIRDDAASLRMRSVFALWAGDDESARRFADAAAEVRSREAEQRRALVAKARVAWMHGERESALEAMRALLRQAPEDLEVRFELGAMLVDDGAVNEGRAILEASARRFNDGLITDVDELVWLGRAMAAAKRPRDANRAFSRALRAEEDHIEANLRLGQLMWSRYNTAEAEAAFEKVLARVEHHPEALVGMAQIEFYKSGRFALSMELVERALEHYPGHPEVQRRRAELLIAQGRWEEGRQVAGALLMRFPEDSEALALKGAAAYLLGDDQAFEALQTRFDARRATRPDFLTTVGEFAALNRRHFEAVRFFEAALERDEHFGPALSGLGIALTRTGDERRGLDILERAFDADRYHVRVFNTLELYERGLRDYLTDDVEGFRLRAHRSQFDLVRRLSEEVVREANKSMSERYGVTLEGLQIEIYSDGDAFSVRTVGLPHIDPHGICFGPVIMTRSPGEANFNWSLVLWHELAHSYHLELSNYRVPRWFTEGLAEYETWLHDPSWTRFHDIDLARRLQHGKMWSLAGLDMAFMTGRGIEISYAYQTAMLAMRFLDEEHGFDSIVALLKGFAEGGSTKEVFARVMKKPLEEVDREFQAWLTRRFSGLMRQELIDLDRVRRMQGEEEVEHRSRGEASAYRALVAATQGDADQARLHLENARRRGGEEEAIIDVIAVTVFDLLDDVEAGLSAGREALDRGVESYDLRYTLTRLASRAERTEEAFVHALSAAMLYPDEPEGWRQLSQRARQVGEERLAERAERELFERLAHTPRLARQRFSYLEARGDYDEAYRAARRWADIAALDAEAHLAVAQMALESRRLAVAQEAFERAGLATPARAQSIWQRAAEAFEAIGEDEIAREFKNR